MSCDVGEVTESLKMSSRAHSPTFPSLHLRQSSFSKPSVALPTTQFILQPLRCFTYATAHSLTLLSFLLRHRVFIYVTWRAVHGILSTFMVDPDGPMVITLATGSEVRGFKAGRGRWIFSDRKNPENDFLRREVKPWVPCRR